MNKDDLRFTRLAAQATLLPNLAGGAATQQALVPQALSPQAASAIYGEIARYGYASFRIIPGGAEIAAPDGSSVIQLTGSAWSFVHDLNQSAFQVAIDKLDVTIKAFMARMPRGTRYFGTVIDLQAVWENLDGRSADAYVESRFLKDQSRQMVADFPGNLEFNGGGVRLNLVGPGDVEMPADIGFAGPGRPLDSFDVRIEPLFADKNKLYLQVTGVFGTPTGDVTVVTRRAQLVHDMLWRHLADNILMVARGGQ